jgi:hypothetical protein
MESGCVFCLLALETHCTVLEGLKLSVGVGHQKLGMLSCHLVTVKPLIFLPLLEKVLIVKIYLKKMNSDNCSLSITNKPYPCS